MNDGDARAVREADAGASSETRELEEHDHGDETARHDLDEAAVGECLREQMLPVLADAPLVVVFEVAEGVEVEADQDGDDLGVGHHAFSAPFWRVGRAEKCVLCHLCFIFLAEIVGDTENFSNFAFGYHAKHF